MGGTSRWQRSDGLAVLLFLGGTVRVPLNVFFRASLFFDGAKPEAGAEEPFYGNA